MRGVVVFLKTILSRHDNYLLLHVNAAVTVAVTELETESRKSGLIVKVVVEKSSEES